MSGEINLLPQRKIGFFSEERVLLGSKILAVALVIIVVSLSILFFLLSRDSAFTNVKQDQSRTIAQLTILQSKTAKYLIIVDRMNKLKTLSKSRLNIDTTIDVLLQNIPKDVSITGFLLDKSTLTIAVSTKNLSSVGVMVDSFTRLIAQKKTFKTLTIQGLVTDEKSGTYIVTLTGGLL